MGRLYLQFIKKFTAYNERIKAKIVTSGFFLKIFFLLFLLFLKVIFVVASFPFFLFSSPDDLTPKNNKNFSAWQIRFQQVVVLTFLLSSILVFIIQGLFSLALNPVSQIHGGAAIPFQFGGSRTYQSNISPSINQVQISHFDNSVTFNGTGPAFAHVEIFVDNGKSLVGTTQANGQGQWIYTQNPEMGELPPGSHSVFVTFFGDDLALLGQPSLMKTFEVSAGGLSDIFRYFNFTSSVIGIISLGIFMLAIVKLKKTVKLTN